MFDIIGKRRWFFLISLLDHDPGPVLHPPDPAHRRQGGPPVLDRLHRRHDVADPLRRPERHAPTRSRRSSREHGLAGDRREAGQRLHRHQDRADRPARAAPPDADAGRRRRGASSAGVGAAPRRAPAASASPAAGAVGVAARRPRRRRRRRRRPAPSASPRRRAARRRRPSRLGVAAPPPATPSSRPRARSARWSTALQAQLGPIAEQASLTHDRRRSSSADLINQALILILVGSIGILLWITLPLPGREVRRDGARRAAPRRDRRRRHLRDPRARSSGVEIDALFVTAMLTVIGFSVHDTIVVFDRIRENRARHAGEPFAEIVNHSILQTFGRSIMTSFTVVLTLLVAAPVRRRRRSANFVLALLIGIISGTYSSIFNASPAARRLARAGRTAGSAGRLARAAHAPRRVLTGRGRGRRAGRAVTRRRSAAMTAVSEPWHPDRRDRAALRLASRRRRRPDPPSSRDAGARARPRRAGRRPARRPRAGDARTTSTAFFAEPVDGAPRSAPPARRRRVPRPAARGARPAARRCMVFGDFDADGLTGLAILVRALRRLGHGRRCRTSRAGSTRATACRSRRSTRRAAAGATRHRHRRLRLDERRRDRRRADAPGSTSSSPTTTALPAGAAGGRSRSSTRSGPTARYPERRLAGSGVAFKLAQLLLADEPGGPAAALDLADLATIGTVADLVPILGENAGDRPARAGADRARGRGRASPRSSPPRRSRRPRVDVETLSFAVAPRINAAGRVGESRRPPPRCC